MGEILDQDVMVEEMSTGVNLASSVRTTPKIWRELLPWLILRVQNTVY